MAFISGSLTDANPGAALHALMAPALTTAGFTLVDTVVISTRTHKVWKSPAAGNVQNLDWYLDIGYTTTGAGTVSLVAFEMFDPATDLAYRGPVNVNNATVDAATGTRYGAAGSALETNWFSAATIATQTPLTATTFGYWISATADRVALMCSTAPSTVMYAGLYQPDPLYAARAGGLIYPLVSGQAGAGGSSAAIGRIAPWTTFPAGTWLTAPLSASPLSTAYPQLPASGTTGYPFVATPLALMAGTATSYFGRWGWYRDVLGLSTTGVVVRGDTCSIGGASHVLGTSTGGTSLAFKAA